MTFISWQKINLILHVFLEILQIYSKLFCFGYFGLCKLKVIPSTCWEFLCLSAGKNQLHLLCFFVDIARHANLFWVLWKCLVMHIQNDSINLQKTSMFICMPKIKFIIVFFLEILHFKESCNLIGWQHFGPQLETQNFVRYGISGEISITILIFILDYLRGKLMTEFFKK